MAVPSARAFPDTGNGSRAFTITEIVIAMFVLAVFLLPLIRHFTSVRRVSLAARDAVIVNSFQSSCVDEIRLAGYRSILPPPGATLTRILQKYEGDRIFNRLPIQTKISIRPAAEPRMATIEIESFFKFPGAPDDAPKRRVSLRGYVFDDP